MLESIALPGGTAADIGAGDSECDVEELHGELDVATGEADDAARTEFTAT